ncbi:SoxR reducing system RseC family protein, partial [Planctomycetota bacterium]
SRTEGPPACGSCCACAAIGGGERELELTASDPPAVGSRVVVEVVTPNAVLSALLVFGIPLLGLVGGVLIGQHWQPLGLSGNADGLVLGFGLLILLLGAAAAVDRFVLRKRLPDPTIVAVLSEGN